MEDWQKKLTPFDAELCKMVESLTGKTCEPKDGGDHFFILVDYENHNRPEYILGIWDAIDGRMGNRILEMKDYPERHELFVKIKFHSGRCKDAAFIPKHEIEPGCE